MKILAIRGRNLASLVGDFEVDFEAAPLHRAGLFAITGPTGAGKSTLLDALCLALFNETPRLSGHGGAQIGRADGEKLGANDVRHLLRRGAAVGFAEVDFLGADDRRWRARWGVRRARDRADGALQNTTLELRDLEDGTVLSAGRRETLEAIEQRLGLDYDQFRRSALLAQGDFAAFLKAAAGERAELLERMTGTDIYGKLSMEAHRRAQKEADVYATLQREVASKGVLEDSARAALEEGRGAARVELDTARAGLAAAEARVRWHEEDRRLDQGVLGGVAAQARAEEAWAAGEPDRSTLAEVEAVAPLRPLVVAADTTTKALAQARAAREAADAQLAQGAQTEQEAREKLARLVEERRLAEEAREKAAPALAEARRLDGVLGQARAREAESRSAAERSARAAQGAAERAAALAAQAAEAEKRRDELERWMGEHAGFASLGEQWARWAEELRRYVRAAGALTTLEEARGRLGQAAAAADLRVAELAITREKSLADAAEAAAGAEAAEGEVGAAPDPEARAALESRRAEVGRVAQVSADAGRVAAELILRLGEAADARRGAEEARAEQARAAGDHERHGAEEAQARWAVDQARAELDLAGRRGELRDGHPCPLCGSPDHPAAHQSGPLANVLAALQARVDEVGAARAAADRASAAAGARLAGALDRAGSAEAAAARLRQEAARLREAWSGWSQVDDPGSADATAAIEAARAAFVADAAALEAAERAWQARSEAARRARAAAVEKQKRATNAADAQRDAERTAEAAQRALTDHERARGQAVTARAEADAALGPALAPLPLAHARLQADPSGFASWLEAEVAAWLARREQRGAAEARLTALQPEIADARARHAQLAQEAELRAREAVEAAGDAATIQAERGALFDNRRTQEVEDALERGIKAATRAETAGREDLASATTLRSNAEAKLEAAGAVLSERTRAADAASLGLAEALAAAGLDLAAALARLAHDDTWIAAQRARLEALRRARVEASTVLAERLAQLARHRETADGGTAEEAQTGHAAAARAADVAQARLSELDLQLAFDDRALAQVAELTPLRDAQKARADVWAALSGLIGSHDGKRFRTFAQGLTLDALLALANEHLAELAPRYRLVRVPGLDLDLQVIDRHLGDEVRSVNSLSGGESFLTSLALALGLASLAARDTRVDSLFIDEGFGTLDPATLEVALATLDALQSTGRKVGLISHVPGLAERIGVQIRVEPQGGGRSRVSVDGG